jgi:6-aminohexanoate-oligomer endohydrolase
LVVFIDGDVLYAVTTNEVDDSPISGAMLGILASELAWDAVLVSGPEQ